MSREEGHTQPTNEAPAMARPPRTTIYPENIPTALTSLDQWLTWRHELNDNRDDWTKVPYQSNRPDTKASSTNSRTWSTFKEALHAYQTTPDIDGIGVAITPKNKLTGVDLDDKLNTETGEIDPLAASIIDNLNSYTELTPSGVGYRVWLIGTLEHLDGRKNTQLKIEFYDRARFFTITGDHVPGTPLSVEERQAELNTVHVQVFPKRKPTQTSTAPAPALNLSDEEIIRSAIRADNGPRFDRLYQNNNSDYNNDASAGDLAFLEHLHFHHATPEQLDRIFRNSPRMRPKWDEMRGKQTYGQLSITKVQDGNRKEIPEATLNRITLSNEEEPEAQEDTEATDPNVITYTHLAVDASRYAINTTGVFPVKLRKEGPTWVEATDYQNPIAGRPIWPNAIGEDHQTGATHVQLAWHDTHGRTQTKWVHHADLNNRETIMNLNGAPVSYGRFARLTDWLADATTWIRTPPKNVFTRPYWHDNKFITTSTPEHEYIGPPAEARGTPEGWTEALEALLQLEDEEAYPALTVLGLSAISPAVQLLDKRRPIVTLAHPSTSGKGAIINLALSIWAPFHTLTSPAGSTWKGTQDNALRNPDLPHFIDEAQQLTKRNAQLIEDLLYFLANGKSRVLSSPNQTVRGGHARYGVAFLAAEEDILEARQGGSQNRVINITTAPLPPNSPALAAKLERAARNHYGVLGPKLVNLINRDAQTLPVTIEGAANQIRNQHHHLRGDDAINLSFLQAGLMHLAEATNNRLPISNVINWLARNVSQQRTQIIDRETKCLTEIINTVLAQQWLEQHDRSIGIQVDHLVIQGEYVAFRGAAATGHSPLEVNPSSRLVKQILREHNFVNPGPDWARRGWISTQSGRVTAKKRHQGHTVGRVWRFTDEALEVAGVTPGEDDEPDT